MNVFRKTPSKRSSPSKGVSETGATQEKASKVLFAEDSMTSDPAAKGSDDSETDNGEKRDKAYYKKLLVQEKEGKRKLFHALVKLVGELKIYKGAQSPNQTSNQAWYEGGLWRAPRVLPNIETQQQNQDDRTRVRQAVSLSDLFFNLVIVTAFTRVGLVITRSGAVTTDSFLYFAVFWTIWSKEASYTTRFDTTDLSAKAGTLVTCFAVLFASLSVSAPMDSEGGSRIMIAGAFCSLLHFGLMARVFFWHSHQASDDTVGSHVQQYALFNSAMNFMESITWILGTLFCPNGYRWIVYTIGVLLGLRIPRAFMANDFHAACTKRGVLFILLLGFMMQSVVVAATDFFEYTIPNDEQYAFIGAACLLLFCIKLLYVDDASTLAADHALLVNRTAALFFNLGQFALLFSTTIMGSGLNLLTHSYLASAAALPGKAKSLVCGGFSAVLICTVFIKSMHLKRVPVAGQQKALFIGAYIIQTVATIAISMITFLMSMGEGGYFQVLMQNDVELMWVLTGFALFLVILSWLDEGLVLALQDDGAESEYLVHPFGFWWCLKPEVDMDTILAEERAQENRYGRLSVLSPLLGESVAKNMQNSMRGYDSTENVTSTDV
ncbi:unnamed protein product [Cylindrotheca closterium]|uniref:Uncharacterized protein n=1 Tax=Cylindrotheca closterium TaxID=2856 RepID=A0AAD2FYU8_9STRA|nr:unnamed protein product [Cylindrotheca closterium]